jgi:hypothetical protein
VIVFEFEDHKRLPGDFTINESICSKSVGYTTRDSVEKIMKVSRNPKDETELLTFTSMLSLFSNGL